MQLFKQAIGLNPDSGRARLRYALLLERSGKAKESADMYAKALAATNPKLAGREKLVAENNLGLMVTDVQAHKRFHSRNPLPKSGSFSVNALTSHLSHFLPPSRPTGTWSAYFAFWKKFENTYALVPFLQVLSYVLAVSVFPLLRGSTRII